jgi:hypothetical protein
VKIPGEPQEIFSLPLPIRFMEKEDYKAQRLGCIVVVIGTILWMGFLYWSITKIF